MATLKPYDNYVPVAYDYVRQLPQDWQLLPNIAVFEERIERGHENEELLSVTIGRGVIRQTELDKKDSSTLDKSKYLLVHPNDLVYSMRFRQGASGYSQYKGIVSPACTVLKPRKGMKYNPMYFHYVFRTGFYKNYAERYAYGIADGQMPLRYVDFKRMYSIVPPLEVQNQIVGYLDRKTAAIDKFIRNKERLIELLEEERSHFILEKVSNLNLGNAKAGWEKKKIKYASKVFRGKFTHRPRNDESLYDGEYPFIQTGDVARASKYITEYSQSLNRLGYKVTTEFPKGTIVMTIAANIGDVAILGFNACFPDSVIGFFPKKNTLNDFLYYSLKVKKDDFLETAIVNTQMNLNVERVSGIFIDIPPISEQRNIVYEIEEHEKYIQKAITKSLREISAIKEYREALISDMVTGKWSVPQ